MGILAPLVPKQRSATPVETRLQLSTGAGTFMTGMLFLFFALAAGGMWFAVAPLLRGVASGDPVLSKVVGIFLQSAAAVFFLVGLGLLGYRQFITCEGHEQVLTAGQSLWGIPIRRLQIPYGEIAAWQVRNQLPRRYRPELQVAGKPVGYWRLEVRTTNETVGLDRAPKEEEMRWLESALREFIEKTSKPADKSKEETKKEGRG